jgi:hypothetical protein
MVDANLYSTDGKYTFYQKGKYFYSVGNDKCEFYQQGKYFYSIKSGQPISYKDGEYLHSMDGAVKYFFR